MSCIFILCIVYIGTAGGLIRVAKAEWVWSFTARKRQETLVRDYCFDKQLTVLYHPART